MALIGNSNQSFYRKQIKSKRNAIAKRCYEFSMGYGQGCKKQGATTGKGATIKKLDENDYEKIKNVLKIFEKDLDIMNLDAFSKTNSKLDLTNIKHKEIDFREFEKIVADENTMQ